MFVHEYVYVSVFVFMYEYGCVCIDYQLVSNHVDGFFQLVQGFDVRKEWCVDSLLPSHFWETIVVKLMAY